MGGGFQEGNVSLGRLHHTFRYSIWELVGFEAEWGECNDLEPLSVEMKLHRYSFDYTEP